LTKAEAFEIFWKAYPRKVARGYAEKTWDKIPAVVSLLPQMLKTLDAWRDSPEWTKDGRKFCPHPATWLNGKGWGDDNPADPDAEDPNDDGEPPQLSRDLVLIAAGMPTDTPGLMWWEMPENEAEARVCGYIAPSGKRYHVTPEHLR
jgi:hypothetical protein